MADSGLFHQITIAFPDQSRIELRLCGFHKINSNSLSDAITQVSNDNAMKTKCVEAVKEISDNNGIEKTVELINKYIGQLSN